MISFYYLIRINPSYLYHYYGAFNAIEVVTTLRVLYVTPGYEPKRYIKNNYQLPCTNRITTISIFHSQFQFIQLHMNPISNFCWNTISSHPIFQFCLFSFPHIEILAWTYISYHRIEILDRFSWPLLGWTQGMPTGPETKNNTHTLLIGWTPNAG